MWNCKPRFSEDEKGVLKRGNGRFPIDALMKASIQFVFFPACIVWLQDWEGNSSFAVVLKWVICIDMIWYIRLARRFFRESDFFCHFYGGILWNFTFFERVTIDCHLSCMSKSCSPKSMVLQHCVVGVAHFWTPSSDILRNFKDTGCRP